jgi:predicted TIM-barrel fold metal-dependent hydrolase
MFCGGVDPNYRGLEDALEQCEYQVKELGAASMKFYNGHLHNSWRCDDEKLAYPIYEKLRDLGIKTIQFHKGLPLGKMPIEPLSPLDLQAPLRDFPDMNFIIHHLAVPPLQNFDHLVNMAGRFENCYLSLSGFWGLVFVAPRLIHDWMGTLLQQVGSHKLLWGSEAALAGGPAPYLKEFMNLEIPEHLRKDYGYPQITRADKELILGRNFAQLMGVDIDAKRKELMEAAV